MTICRSVRGERGGSVKINRSALMTEVPDWWPGPAGIVDLVTGADERIRARGMIWSSVGGPGLSPARK